MNLKASYISKSGLVLILMMMILTTSSLASISHKAVVTGSIHPSSSEDKMLSGTATFPANGTTEPTPLVNSQTSMDNGFAIGAGYKYSGSGDSDFNFYFINNGFSSSNGNPEQIVLTATTDQMSYQISIYIYNSSKVVLDDEAWFINTTTPYLLFHLQYGVSGIINSWHIIELKIFSLNGIFYTGYYLDGTCYDSWTTGGASTFDAEMVPSVVIESADTVSSDWNSKTVDGFLRTGSTNLNTQFYGGTWGADNAGFIALSQTSSIYVGQNVQSPNNVGTSGYILGYGIYANQLALGDTRPFFIITDPIISSEYSTFSANAWGVQVS